MILDMSSLNTDRVVKERVLLFSRLLAIEVYKNKFDRARDTHLLLSRTKSSLHNMRTAYKLLGTSDKATCYLYCRRSVIIKLMHGDVLTCKLLLATSVHACTEQKIVEVNYFLPKQLSTH
jgi:hypothetical protein